MSRISDLRQIISQTTRVEKVQQVQQIQGDLENARLAAQAQKRSDEKKGRVQDAPPSDHIEVHNKKRDEDRGKREKGQGKKQQKQTEREEKTKRIDIRI